MYPDITTISSGTQEIRQGVLSQHCGSISPRVSQFPVGLRFLVSTPFFFGRSLFLGLMSHPRVVDASDRRVPRSPVPFPFFEFWFSYGLWFRPRWYGSQRMRSSMYSCYSLHKSKSRSRRFPQLRVGCPVWNHTSLLHLEDLLLDLQRWNRISVPSLHDCAKLKQVLPLPQIVSGSARSWPALEQVDGSTVAGSHGPGSSDENRNTRRRLDTFSSPDDENVRSAVLFISVPL